MALLRGGGSRDGRHLQGSVNDEVYGTRALPRVEVVNQGRVVYD